MFLSARIVRAVKAADVGPIIVSSAAAFLRSKVTSGHLAGFKALHISDKDFLAAPRGVKVDIEPRYWGLGRIKKKEH
jgi:hypothetical protein